MERFTPLYAITNNMEHVRFDEEDYFHVLVFYGLFYKRNRRHFPMFPYVIETLVEVWENSKLRGKTRGSLGEQHFNFSFSQTSTRVSITVWKHGKCFLFLKHIAWFVLDTMIESQWNQSIPVLNYTNNDAGEKLCFIFIYNIVYNLY